MNMTNHHDAHTESSPRPKVGSFQFRFGSRLVTVTIPPYLVVVLLTATLAGYLLGQRSASLEAERQERLLSIVLQRNSQLERSLKEREEERDQLVDLAEARSQELWSELDARDRELRRLWNLVGKPAEVAPRRQSLASRGTAESPRDRYRMLQSRVQAGNDELQQLAHAARQYRARSIPAGPPCAGEMTSGFGYRVHPVYGFSKLHNGCDFTADHGTPIRATAGGEVVRSEWYGGYGNTVEVEHPSGLKTLYAHCQELKVRKGERVKKGQLIATVGSTGLSSGPHCHYEVHLNGQPVDPRPYLKSR